MAHFTPIRGSERPGDIIGLAPTDQAAASGFAALVQETMTATGAAPAPAGGETCTPRHSFGRKEAAGLVAGLFLAAALIALITRLTPAQDAPRPAARPTSAPAIVAPMVEPTIAPTLAPSPTVEPSATPEPQIVYVEVEKPCYSVTMDVYDGSRPLGTVTGQSCESQEAAQQAADALAATMKGE